MKFTESTKGGKLYADDLQFLRIQTEYLLIDSFRGNCHIHL